MKNKDEIYLATTDQDKDAVTALHSMCDWNGCCVTFLKTVFVIADFSISVNPFPIHSSII